MRSSLLALVSFAALCPAIALAQTAPITTPVPTTKVLAIGHIVAGAPDPQAMRAIMPSEVRDTVNLYLAGKLDQWFVRQDTNGVVFLLNATSVADATEMLSKLPLVKAKRMEFELIPLGPLSPLRYLLGDAANAAKP
jgi:hypothetical protein